MIFSLFRRNDPNEAAAYALYRTVVAQARRPEFYTDLGVPDTLDGRFDMITLHAFLVLYRLRGVERKDAGKALSQRLFDLMFADMDQNLREMGVGDLSVGKKIKAMTQAFNGRIHAYDAGLAAPEDGADANATLRGALRRNVFGTIGDEDPVALSRMADYVRAEVQGLARQPDDAILKGQVAFGAPPDGTSTGQKGLG